MPPVGSQPVARSLEADFQSAAADETGTAGTDVPAGGPRKTEAERLDEDRQRMGIPEVKPMTEGRAAALEVLSRGTVRTARQVLADRQ